MSSQTKTKITMEDLTSEYAYTGAVINYDNIVIATYYAYHTTNQEGFIAKIYKLLEDPFDGGWGKESRSIAECALKLVKESKEYFTDPGHAIAWALNQTSKKGVK